MVLPLSRRWHIGRHMVEEWTEALIMLRMHTAIVLLQAMKNKPNTSEPLVVKGGSINAPNDYWDHADYVIEAVKKRNMYLALLPCWASQLITGKGLYTVEQAKTYGAFIRQTLWQRTTYYLDVGWRYKSAV